MARTYTKKTKMNTITEFADLLSAEEMEFFPSLDLSLPTEFGSAIDDVFQGNALPKESTQDFSADDILQELDLEGGDKLLETDWLTQKFDFTSFDPALANTSETLQELTQVEETEFGSSFADLSDALLNQPMGENLLSISIEMPTTPEQKVPEFAAVSPYSVDSVTSPENIVSHDSSQSSPCSPYSDTSSDSTVCLVNLLTNDNESFASPSISKQTEVVDEKIDSSRRQTPYSRSTSKTITKPKVKTPAQKQRKRVQNKDAATRYRVKKRSEQEKLFEEAESIEKENSALKDQVASISKEIEYLKNLMLEVYKTKKKKEAALSKAT